jgi:hypothetical protein
MTLAPMEARVGEGSSAMRHSSICAVLVATMPASFLFTVVWALLWQEVRRGGEGGGGRRGGGKEGRKKGGKEEV